MKKSSRIKLLLLCLIISIVSFAFACDTGAGADVTLDQYVDNGRIINYKTYGDVKVDGILDDEVWENQIKLERELTVDTYNGVDINYNVTMSSYFAEDGVIMYIDVKSNGGVYINKLRTDHYNTGMEIYIISGDKTTPEMNLWEIPLLANGRYDSRVYTTTWGGPPSYIIDARCHVDVKTQIDGLEGTHFTTDDISLTPEESEGYTLEFYIPYSNLNEQSKPSSITMTAAVVHMNEDIIKEKNEDYNTLGIRKWVDIHQACDGVAAQTNLDAQYVFNHQGFLDKKIETVRNVKINGVEGSDGVVENGRLELDIPLAGQVGSITAIPDAGYMFDYLIVNGVKQDSPYYEIKKNMGNLDIEVGFKPLEGDILETFTVNVQNPSGAILGYELNGKVVRLVSEKGIFDAEVVEGVATFTNVPVGEYAFEVLALSGINTSIVLEKDVTEYTIELKYQLFDDSTTSDNLTYTYDSATKSYTIISKNNGINTDHTISFAKQDSKIVWTEMTVGFDKEKAGVTDTNDVLLNGIDSTNKIRVGLWYVGKDSTDVNNPGIEGKELRLRTTTNWNWKALSDIYTPSSEDDLQTRMLAGEKISIAVNLIGNTAYVFYKMEADTEWYLWDKASKSGKSDTYNSDVVLSGYTEIAGITSKCKEETITGIKVANESSMYDANLGITSVDASVNDDTMGTVNATGSIYGGSLRIIPQPNEGYMLADVKVNGVSYPAEVTKFNSTGKAIYAPSKVGVENKVVVTFCPVIETNEYTITLKDANGNFINGDVQFFAEGVFSPVVKATNGVVKVELGKGINYVIKVDGYSEATVSISADGELTETTYTLQKGILYTNSTVFSYGVNDVDGNWFTSSTNAGNEVLFVEGSDYSAGKAVKFHLDASLELETVQNVGFRVYDGDYYVAFQLTTSGGYFQLKRTRPNFVQFMSLDLRDQERLDKDVTIYIEGKTVVFTMGGEYLTHVVVHETFGPNNALSTEVIKEIDKVGFFFQYDKNPDFKVTQIAVTDDKFDFIDFKAKETADADYTAVTDVNQAFDKFSLKLNSLQLVAGQTANITIAPTAEDAFIDGITINGVEQSFETSATGEVVLDYDIPTDATAVEIIVKVATQTLVEGTMKVYLASFDGNVAITDLTKLTFNGNALEGATVNDETISFTIGTGVYEVAYTEAGYETFVITVTEEATDFVVYLNKIAFTGSTTFDVKYDYNGADGVNVTRTSGSREFLKLAETVEGLKGFTFKFELAAGANSAYPIVYLTNTDGISASYQLCVSGNRLSIKAGIHDGTTNGLDGDELATVGYCSTGAFSADVTFFAVGTDLIISFTNVISNGAPAEDKIIVHDSSSNNSGFSLSWGVTARFDNPTVNSMMIAHDSNGGWKIKNIELLTAIPSAQVVPTDNADAKVETSANTVEFGSSVEITVTPSSNAMVTAIVINGEEYPVSAEAGAVVTYTINNNKVIDKYEVSAIVASTFATGTITIANGKIIGATGIETFTTDLTTKSYQLLNGDTVIASGDLVNGVANVENVPFGTYTIKVDGGNYVGTVVIDQVALDTVATVDAVMFTLYKGDESTWNPLVALGDTHKADFSGIYTEGEDAIVYAPGNHNVLAFFNEDVFGGKVVYVEQVVTLNKLSSEGFIQGVGAYPTEGSGVNIGIRYNPSEFQARVNNVGWSYDSIPGTAGKTSIKVKMVTYVVDGALTLKIYDEVGNLLNVLVDTAKNYEYLTYIANKNSKNEGGEVVHSLKIATALPTDVATEGKLFTAVPDKTTVAAGETVTITVTPNNNDLAVKAVWVVDNTYVNATYAGGVYTATWTNSGTSTATVEITVAAMLKPTATLDLGEESDLYTLSADPADVKFGETTTITVTPKDGKNVTVSAIIVAGDRLVPTADGNGVYTVTWTNDDVSLTAVDVTVEASEKALQTYTVAVDYRTAQETTAYAINGRKLKFAGETNVDAIIGEDGNVTVQLFAGEYTATLENGATLNFTATEDPADAVALNFVGMTAGVNETNISKSDNGDGTFNFTHKTNAQDVVVLAQGTNVGGTVVTFDYNLVITGTDAGQGFELYSNGNRIRISFYVSSTLQFAIQKKFNGDDNGTWYTFDDPKNIQNAPVVFAVSEDGKTINVSIVIEDTEIVRTFTLSHPITKLSLGGCCGSPNSGHTYSMNNVMVSDINSPAEVEVVEGDLYTISTDKDSIKNTDEAKIIITPKESTVKITAVVVNGVQYPITADNGVAVEYTLKHTYASSYEVSAIATKEVAKEYTFNVTYRTAQEAAKGIDAYAYEGRKVTITGENISAIERTVTNGVIAVELLKGTYTAKIDNGAESVEFTVDGETLAGELEFVGKAISAVNGAGMTALDGDGVANDYTASTMNHTLLIAEGDNLAGTVVTFDYYLTNNTTGDQGQGIKLFTANKPYSAATADSNRHRFHLINRPGQFLCVRKDTANVFQEQIAITSNVIEKAKVVVVVSEDGYELIITITLGGNKATYTWGGDGSPITRLEIGHPYGPNANVTWSMRNIMVSDIYAPAKVDVVEGELYRISTSADYIKHGAPATITVTPIGNSKVTAIVVNGVVYPVEAANGATVEYVLNTSYAASYEVSAIATEEVIPMYTIDIDYRTAQEAAKGIDAYAIDGRTVKFVGPETKEVEIVDGKVTLSLAAGDYTVTLGNGATLSFTATENVEDAAKTLNFVGMTAVVPETNISKTNNGDYTYNITHKTNAQDVITVAQGTNVGGTVVTFDYYMEITTGGDGGQGIRLFTANKPTSQQRFNLITYPSGDNLNLHIKDQNSGDNGDTITFTSKVEGAKVTVVVSEDGKTLTITLTYNGQTITRTWSDGSVITTLQIGGCCGTPNSGHTYSMNNIMVSDINSPNN